MLNKLFLFVTMIVCSSFLLSNELTKSQNKEKNKSDSKQIEKRRHLPTDKKEQINEKKKLPVEKKKKRLRKGKNKKFSNKKEAIKALKKEYRIKKTEIRNLYDARINRLKKTGENSKLMNSNAKQVKRLKLEGKAELETLEKEFRARLKQIKNN